MTGPALKYRAIVFDFDGVLVESTEVKDTAFYELYLRHGEAIARRALAAHRVQRGTSRYEKLRQFHRDLLGVELSETGLQKLANEYADLVERKVIAADPVPGSNEFLERYFNLLPLYMASATPVGELLRIVDARGLRRFFRECYGFPTRKAEALRLVAGGLRVDPREILMVGDASADWEAAQAAGSGFVGRNVGEDRQFPDSVTTIRSLDQLEALVRE